MKKVKIKIQNVNKHFDIKKNLKKFKMLKNVLFRKLK
jgi:hypothetical protein